MDVSRMHELRAAFPGAWPDNPWDHEHPVFKVGAGERGKIFAFLAATTVGESYRLVVSKLPRKDRPAGWAR